MAKEPIVNRDYVDNSSVKEFVINDMVPAYFGDIDVNLRSASILGLTTELITNTSEDAFNTGSVLFRECYPNRSQLDESIYSHAAIFQLDDVFARAASCKFLLLLDEESIIKNMTGAREFSEQYSGMYEISDNKNKFYFCIDKNTKIYIEDIPFSLDYDIIVTVVKKITDDGYTYLFSARYVIEDYTNSISELPDPYVKVRRSSDGFIALEVQTHQCERKIYEEPILTNNEINYSVIDIKYDGKLAGFDILYKAPTDTEYHQMETLIVYSQAIKSPFCYYQLIENSKLRITFNTKDTFFMPAFNSDIKVIMYITNGEEGEFDVYKGKNITCVPSTDVFSYSNTFLVGAKAIGSAKDAKDQTGTDVLQALTVEGYRTANALTTDNDLQEYFNNYKFRYGDSDILFIKKRDDVYERIFSAFMVIRNGDEIYKTNTLNLHLNLYDMINNEKDVFILEPGTVFTCSNNNDGYAEFFRDSSKNDEYYKMYQEAVKNGTIPYIDNMDPSSIPAYLDRPASFAQYKSRLGLDDKVSVWELTEEDYEKYDQPTNSKYLLINPFLLKFTKSPNLVSTYMTYVDNTVSVDFINQNSDMYLQFTMYTFTMTRRFTKEKEYKAKIVVSPSMSVDSSNTLIFIDGKDSEGKNIYHLGDPYNLEKNDLRIFMVVMDGSTKLCYTEMVPTVFNRETENITFEATMYTDDHITSLGNLRILPMTIYRNKDTGDYYKEKEDRTLCNLYNKDGNIIQENVSRNIVQELITSPNTPWYVYKNTVNMWAYDDILIPIDDVEIKIFICYNKNFSEEYGGLRPIPENQGSNPFIEYDSTLNNYTWTNEYSTSSSPVIFVKSLSNVRTFLDFLDYTKAEDVDGETVFIHDIMDVEMRSISFLRASATQNEEYTDYFFNSFYQNYLFLSDIIKQRLRNVTSIDLKFYNTYGRSKNFIIGERDDILDTLNIKIYFDMWFVDGTDLLVAIPEIKKYIKSQIETINEKGMNRLFISNLMRKIEDTFSYVDHIRFKHINAFDSTYQAIKNYVIDLDDLTIDERRWYVPELIMCDIDDIHIVDYIATV